MPTSVAVIIASPVGTAAATGTSAKKISESKKVAKDIAQVLECRGIEPGRSGAAYTGVTEAVVSGTLVGVRQNRVCLAALLELLFGVGIVGIAVGMELQRQLAIGALDLLLGRAPPDAKDLVVVAFPVARQNRSILPFLLVVWIYRFEFCATLTIDGRSRRPFSLYPRCSSSSTW